jgi:hypothetical protein
MLRRPQDEAALPFSVGDTTQVIWSYIRHFLRNFNRSSIFGTVPELQTLVTMRLPC